VIRLGRAKSSIAACRGFRTLDSLDDDDCVRLVDWLSENSPGVAAMYSFARLLIVLVVLVGWAVIVVISESALSSSMETLLWENWFRGMVLALLFAPGGALALAISSAARRGAATALISRALKRAPIDPDHATKCGYELKGLKRSGSLVICPECGRTIDVRPRSLFEQLWVGGKLVLPSAEYPTPTPDPPSGHWF
jgi:hypothetical protein